MISPFRVKSLYASCIGPYPDGNKVMLGRKGGRLAGRDISTGQDKTNAA